MTTGQEGLIQIYAKQLRLPTVADFAAIAREATQHHWGYEEFLREEKQPVLMFGNPGTGKTHLAIGLGYQACCLGYSVRFCTAGQLVTDLAEASQQGRLSS
ncbi:MAG: ATP-binding protein, partial [Firmicutes bacterium]|nr:ATP-binding protein [Bacillota bacterium]